MERCKKARSVKERVEFRTQDVRASVEVGHRIREREQAREKKQCSERKDRERERAEFEQRKEAKRRVKRKRERERSVAKGSASIL